VIERKKEGEGNEPEEGPFIPDLRAFLPPSQTPNAKEKEGGGGGEVTFKFSDSGILFYYRVGKEEEEKTFHIRLKLSTIINLAGVEGERGKRREGNRDAAVSR